MSKSCALPRATFPVKFKVHSPAHALELARDLIRPFKNWTTGELAVKTEVDRYTVDGGRFEDVERVPVSPKDPKAEAFCALGALRRVNSKYEKAAQRFLELAAASELEKSEEDIEDIEEYGASEEDIFDVNDGGDGDRETHRTVLRMFAKAIRLAKKAAGRGDKKQVR